jgi:threonine/homoserine/homoserine lactone efflux protein
LLLLTVVKFVGAAFLVYLGIQAIRHRKRVASAPGELSRRSRWRTYGEGVVVGLTNPKLAVFFVAMLPQFVDPATGPVPVQMLVLGSVFIVVALLIDSCWALGAGLARDWFARSPKRSETLGATGGVAMVGLGVGLAVTAAKN